MEKEKTPGILRTEEILRAIAEGIKEILPGMGFALVVFKFDDPSIGNYISNAEREGMIEALRETADRLEANQDIPPTKGSA